jgi:hypothetical protein
MKVCQQSHDLSFLEPTQVPKCGVSPGSFGAIICASSWLKKYNVNLSGDSDWDDYSPVTTCTAESVGSRQRLEDESKSTASASLLVKGDSDATTNSAVSNWLVAAFVFVLAVGVFANTANHGFTFDDQVRDKSCLCCKL